MSDMETDTTEDPQEAVDPAGLRKALKEQGETNSDLRRQNEQLQREMAFRDAGVPEDGPGKWFRQGYDGDVDAAKIRETALADGIISSTDTQPAEQTPEAQAEKAANAEEMMQFERFDVAGGQPEAAPTPEGFENGLRDSKSYDEATRKLRDAGMMEPR